MAESYSPLNFQTEKPIPKDNQYNDNNENLKMKLTHEWRTNNHSNLSFYRNNLTRQKWLLNPHPLTTLPPNQISSVAIKGQSLNQDKLAHSQQHAQISKEELKLKQFQHLKNMNDTLTRINKQYNYQIFQAKPQKYQENYSNERKPTNGIHFESFGYGSGLGMSVKSPNNHAKQELKGDGQRSKTQLIANEVSKDSLPPVQGQFQYQSLKGQLSINMTLSVLEPLDSVKGKQLLQSNYNSTKSKQQMPYMKVELIRGSNVQSILNSPPQHKSQPPIRLVHSKQRSESQEGNIQTSEEESPQKQNKVISRNNMAETLPKFKIKAYNLQKALPMQKNSKTDRFKQKKLAELGIVQPNDYQEINQKSKVIVMPQIKTLYGQPFNNASQSPTSHYLNNQSQSIDQISQEQDNTTTRMMISQYQYQSQLDEKFQSHRMIKDKDKLDDTLQAGDIENYQYLLQKDEDETIDLFQLKRDSLDQRGRNNSITNRAAQNASASSQISPQKKIGKTLDEILLAREKPYSSQLKIHHQQILSHKF